MTIERAITCLTVQRELMTFDSVTGEDIPLSSLSIHQAEIYNALGIAIKALEDQRWKER